jgi:hypothetical protein
MSTAQYVSLLVGLAPLAMMFHGCDGPECGPSASCPAPPPPMLAEISDFGADLPVGGQLNFYEAVVSEPLELSVAGSSAGLAAHLSRAQAVDLFAGRVVDVPSTVLGGSANYANYGPLTAEVHRPIRTLQLSIDADSSVTIVALLGAAERAGPVLTASMTVRGPLQLACYFTPAGADPAQQQADPTFSSRFCAGLSVELGLRGLVARSLDL